MAKVISNVSPENIRAMADILTRIVGTPVQPTGDIEFTINGERYVVKAHEGAYYAAAVER